MPSKTLLEALLNMSVLHVVSTSTGTTRKHSALSVLGLNVYWAIGQYTAEYTPVYIDIVSRGPRML